MLCFKPTITIIFFSRSMVTDQKQANLSYSIHQMAADVSITNMQLQAHVQVELFDRYHLTLMAEEKEEEISQLF